MSQTDLALLLLRLVIGLFLVAHGWNKVAGGLKNTAGWFRSIGMRWPLWQARAAAATEIVTGLLLAAGLLTALAAAGMISVMLVAITVAHRKVGFFVFRPGQGWEYCATIAMAAFCIAMAGPGRWSLDDAIGLAWFDGWTGAVVAGAVGVGSAAAHLAVSYRPASVAATAAAS